MTRKNQDSRESETLQIGKIIKDQLHRQERTVTWLSRMIHCDRRNVYDIFSRASIDTDLLYKISIALRKDFFAYYSTDLQKPINNPQNPTSLCANLKTDT